MFCGASTTIGDFAEFGIVVVHRTTFKTLKPTSHYFFQQLLYNTFEASPAFGWYFFLKKKIIFRKFGFTKTTLACKQATEIM